MRLPFIVKVCGVTAREDAQHALDAGANALGFNFYPPSPRYIAPVAAADMIAGLRGDFLRVGVFVNPAEMETAFLDIVQLHGDSVTADTTLPKWRAINPGKIPAPNAQVDAWLLDSLTPAFGGSGKTFDWSFAAGFPYRCIVAGGLDGDNVADAIRLAKPWGVDSCSRLEGAPGRKDHKRVAAFVTNALEAFHANQSVSI